MNAPLTQGVHHVGLTVSQLDASASFFITVLGWKEVKRNDAYPAIFISDGHILLTLWAAQHHPVVPFNRKENVGLHHLALQVADEAALHTIYDALTSHGTTIEFGPEQLGAGPAKHMMCYDPSGIRLEFIWLGGH